MENGPRRTAHRASWARIGAIALLLIGTGSTAWAQEAPGLAAEGEVVLTLPEAVREALGRSREIRTARLAVEEADERVSEAWGNLYPSFDFSATYTRNLSPAVNFLPASIFDPTAGPDEFIQVQFGADNSWQATVSAEQILFDGRAFIGVGVADQYRELQNETLRGRAQVVVTRVRNAYHDLLLAQEQVRLTENSLRRVEEALEETRALNRAGLVSDYDVLRLEVEQANLRPNLYRAANAAATARRTLALELDIADADRIRVAGSLAEMDLEEGAENTPANRAILEFAAVEFREGVDVEELVRIAEERRSDVRQMELTETLRLAEMRVEQVEYLPKISAFGDYGISAQQNGAVDFFGRPRAYSRRAGVMVSVPIFTGLQRDARVDQRRAALRQAETLTRLGRDQGEVEVRNLIDAAREARLRAEAQELAVQLAGRGYDIASAQYREGLGSQLELTDAEVALRESEFNYAEAVYDFLVARSRLDQAVGLVPLVDTGVEGAR